MTLLHALFNDDGRCPGRLAGNGPRCTRVDGHLHGCVYVSSAQPQDHDTEAVQT